MTDYQMDLKLLNINLWTLYKHFKHSKLAN